MPSAPRGLPAACQTAPDSADCQLDAGYKVGGWFELGLAPVEGVRGSTTSLDEAVTVAAKDDAASRFGFPTAKAWAKALKGDLDAVVLRALRKEPEQRYASVSHLVEDLQRYRNGERTAARGDASGGWREWFKRR